jgi:hypothetical protein
VFQTPVPTYVEAQSRLISVEVYDDTAPGTGTLIVMGELETTDPRWAGKFNYRWSSQIAIEPNRQNTSPIIFEDTPAVDIEELRIINRQTASFTPTSQTFTASLTPLYQDNSQIGYLVKAIAPFQFTPRHIAESTVARPTQLSGSISIGTPSQSADVVLDIDEILNSDTAFATNLIRLDSTILDSMLLYSGTYTTTIANTPTPVTASVKLYYDIFAETGSTIYTSFAQIRAYGLNTVSGEIHKIRVSVRESEIESDFKLVADVDVPSPDVLKLSLIGELLSTASQFGYVPIGDMYHYSSHYPSASIPWYADKLEATEDSLYLYRGVSRYYTSSMPATEAYTLYYDNDTLLNSMYAHVPVVGTQFTGSVSASGYFIGTPVTMELFEDSEYELEFSGYYRNTSGSSNLTGNAANIDIYLIGVNGTTLTSLDPLGQKLGTVSASIQDATYWLESNSIIFAPNVVDRGDVSLRFVVRNGFWNFANISITPATNVGFAPDEFYVLVANTEYHNALLQHKIEFLDVNNNSINLSAISAPTYFTGSAIDFGILP